MRTYLNSAKNTGMIFKSVLLLMLLFWNCTKLYSRVQYPVYYSGDNLKVEMNKQGEPEKIILEGNVKIIFQDQTLLAKKAEFNTISFEIQAEGPLHLESREGTFTADYLFYNFLARTGVLYNADFKAPPLYGRASTIEQDNSVITLYRGYVTTCNIDEHPHYRLSAERIEYVEDDYIMAERIKLTFGDKFHVFYLPRLTMDVRAKEPPVAISPGYQTSIGQNLEITVSHRTARESDTLLQERLNLGMEGGGAGMSISSDRHRYRLAGFFYNRWDDGSLKYGLLGEFKRNYTNHFGYGHAIFNSRFMYDSEFFHDFFRNDFTEKSKTYNHLSVTQNANVGILHIGFRQNPGENILETERLPELRFYTPLAQVGNSHLFFENDLRITNFNIDGENSLKLIDVLKLKSRHNMGVMTLTPYLTGTAAGCTEKNDDKINFSGEAGAKISTAMWKKEGALSKYLVPSVSLLHRNDRLNEEALEHYGLLKKGNAGTFLNLGLSWYFSRAATKRGSILVENFYDIEGERFQASLLKHDLQIANNLYLEGQNEWDMDSREYRFGANDVTFRSQRHRYSIGNRYDAKNSVSGISNRFEHAPAANWRYGLGIDYDLNENDFSKTTFEIWRKLHCWELHFRISSDRDDFSFFITAYPVFI